MIGKNIFTSKLKNKFRPFNGFISEYVKLKSKWGKIYDISYQHFSQCCSGGGVPSTICSGRRWSPWWSSHVSRRGNCPAGTSWTLGLLSKVQTMLNERELSVLPRATVSTSEFCLRTLTVIVFRLKLLTPDCEAMTFSDNTDFYSLFKTQKSLIF